MNPTEHGRLPHRVEHYLPRFLLSGFAAEGTTGACRVFLFRRGYPGHVVNTRRIGAERDFYGVFEGVDLEKQLSREESRYAPLVARLRDGQQQPEDSSVIAEFINLQAARVKHFRAAFGDGIPRLLAAVQNSFQNSEGTAALARIIRRKALVNSQLTRLINSLSEPLRPVVVAYFDQSCTTLIASGAADEVLTELRKRIDVATLVRNAHVGALSKALTDGVPSGAMGALAWSVRNLGGPLILGDVGPVAKVKGKLLFETIHKDTTTVDAVFLPISAHLAIVGTRTADDTVEIDAESLNKGTAEVSREFFISSSNGVREADYSASIGCRADLFADFDFDEMMRRAIEDLERELFEKKS